MKLQQVISLAENHFGMIPKRQKWVPAGMDGPWTNRIVVQKGRIPYEEFQNSFVFDFFLKWRGKNSVLEVSKLKIPTNRKNWGVPSREKGHWRERANQYSRKTNMLREKILQSSVFSWVCKHVRNIQLKSKITYSERKGMDGSKPHGHTKYTQYPRNKKPVRERRLEGMNKIQLFPDLPPFLFAVTESQKQINCLCMWMCIFFGMYTILYIIWIYMAFHDEFCWLFLKSLLDLKFKLERCPASNKKGIIGPTSLVREGWLVSGPGGPQKPSNEHKLWLSSIRMKLFQGLFAETSSLPGYLALTGHCKWFSCFSCCLSCLCCLWTKWLDLSKYFRLFLSRWMWVGRSCAGATWSCLANVSILFAQEFGLGIRFWGLFLDWCN